MVLSVATMAKTITHIVHVWQELHKGLAHRNVSCTFTNHVVNNLCRPYYRLQNNTIISITIQWTGLDWNTGLDYWADIYVLHIL